MLFSDHIQKEVLRNPDTNSLVSVFDKLQTYKVSAMSPYFRFFNVALISDRKWINKMLNDYSIEFPIGYPFEPMQQFILNVTRILSLAGSKIGTELLVSVLSLGEVEVLDSSFIRETDILILDSSSNGYLSSSDTHKHYMAISDSEQLKGLDATLTLNVNTPFAADSIVLSVVDNFIRELLNRYVPFNQGISPTINYSVRDTPYYHELLNQFFVCRQ